MPYLSCRPWVRGALFIGAASLASCSHGSDTVDHAGDGAAGARVGREVTIGVGWPWSAHVDIHLADGIQLAVDQANATGGVRGRPVRIVRGDDQGSVDGGRLVAHAFTVTRDMPAVIGHLQSFVTVPAAAVYDAAGTVLYAPVATDPSLTHRGYRRVFRGTFTDDMSGVRMADLAAARGYKRIAIYYIRDIYGRGLANAFERRAQAIGLRVVARESYEPTEDVTARSFRITLRDWGHQELDAIFIAGELPSAAVLVAEARKAGLHMPILGGDAMSSADLIRIAGPAADGMIVASMFHPSEPRPEVREFVRAFRDRYHADPDAGAALGYDAVRLLVDAMRRAGSTRPDSLALALHATRGWPGATGVFTFDPDGDLLARRVLAVVVKDGGFAYLPDVDPAVAMASTP